MTGARVVTLLVALLTAALLVSSAAGASGEIRVLYVLATWGPTTFSREEAEAVAQETDEFFRASSFGRLSMPGSVAGPVRLPRAAFDSCDAEALRNVAPSSTVAGHSRVVFVTPHVPRCRFAGMAAATDALLNGQLDVWLAVHELGHTLGLAHANSWHCIALGCTVDEYGNPFSVMGEGKGDFNAWEKAALGWLAGVARAGRAATYEIGPIESSTSLPQAFVVTTAASEFWFESRGRHTPSLRGRSEQPPGVAVIAGPAEGARRSPYPSSNILLPNPSGGMRVGYATGESFVVRGVFSVLVERHAATSATLRLEWLDRVAPGASRLRARATGRGRVDLTWSRSLERGSGIESYTVLADGRVARVVSGQQSSATTIRLAPGAHRVGAFATDRAGNRGPLTTARVIVR